MAKVLEFPVLYIRETVKRGRKIMRSSKIDPIRIKEVASVQFRGLQSLVLSTPGPVSSTESCTFIFDCMGTE
jgi:hypothetical protein